MTAHSCPFGASGVQPQDTPEIENRERKGPPPARDGKLVVDFYEEYQEFPCDDMIYSGPRRDETAKNSDENVIIEACDQWKMCKLTVDDTLLIAPDAITISYVKEAIAEFNKRNQASNVSFLDYSDEKLKAELTVANLVDAIRMHPSDQVPANVACVLGKTIGATASDPQAPDYDNIFGAFLAFMGLDAASFPSKYTYDCHDGNNVINNKRFPCGSGYWWGGYVDSNQKDQKGYGKRATVFETITGERIWQTFPLSGLLRGTFPTHGGDGLLEKPTGMKPEQVNAEEYYRDVFADRYYDLLHPTECKYLNGETLTKAKVLEYIDLLCKYGDEIKPKAWLECNQTTKQKKAVRRPKNRKVGASHKKNKKVVNRKKRTVYKKQQIRKNFGAYNKKCAGC